MPGWVPDAVFYELIPDRLEPPLPAELAPFATDAFEPWEAVPAHRAYKGGTLPGVIRHLDRLAELGVTALLLTPVTASPTSHRYKPVDLFHADPMLGGDEAVASLLREAHARGLKVVLDLVVNHVGVGCLPFADLIEYGERSPYRDWFEVRQWPVRPHCGAPTYRCWNDNASMPVLNHRHPGARALVVRAAEHWARQGADGLRLDAASEVEHRGLFDELRAAVKAINPELYLVGEAWGDASSWLDGQQWDGATNYPLHFAIRELCAGSHLDLAQAHPGSMREGGIDAAEYARRIDGLLTRVSPERARQQLNFIDGHDVARMLTLSSGDPASVSLACLLLFTFPGAPCVYYGAEVGLPGGMPPDCRRGFPAPSQWDQGTLATHRRLIALRRAHPALRTGEYRTVHAEGRAYALLRRDAHEAFLVAVNAGDTPVHLALDEASLSVEAPVVCEGVARLERVGGRLLVALEARAGAIIDLQGRARLPVVPVRQPPGGGREVVVIGNIGVDTNAYLPEGFQPGAQESSFTEDLDTIGQAGGYSSFGFAALGRRTGFVGALGDDVLGRWIGAELAEARVEALTFVDPAGTSRSINLMARDGSRKTFYDGKSHLRLAPDLERCRQFLAGARLAHFHLANWARQLLPVARALGVVVSSDLQDLTDVDDPYRRDFIEASSILFCSAVNLEARVVGEALLRRNPGAVIVFGLGSRGAALCTAEGFRTFPPVALDRPVVDTNGAGDSLAVGFLTARVLEGRPLEEAVRWGQTAARWACTERLKWRRLITRDSLEALMERAPAQDH